MQIDEATYERIMDKTPIKDLDPTWRISSFKASKKWCDFAHDSGVRQGFGTGIFLIMVALALANTTLVLFDVPRGWPSVVVPVLLAVTAIVWTVGAIRIDQLYMYGDDK